MNLRRSIALFFLLIALPLSASAATFAEKKNLVYSTPTPDNAYLAGTSVTVSTALPADLAAIGGTVTTYSPIGGDALVAGGTVDLEQPVVGDVRAVGARVTVASTTGGDVVVAGAQVNVSGTARDMRIAGASVQVTGGAHGPVVIYGADVLLSGTYDGDVDIFASDRFTLGENTHIHGVLRYNAPTQVDVPASSVVDGGATYTGSPSYVPTNAEAKKFALAGVGIFYAVRALAVMIAAALLAGVFPAFTLAFTERAYARRLPRAALFVLLGFAFIVATPIFIILMLVSFVGAALALLLFSMYTLLISLAYLYIGILAGGLLRRATRRKSLAQGVSWKYALLGMLVFFIVSSIPFIGWMIALLALCFSLGTLVSGLYAFAFPRDTSLWDQ
jgi:hypothetical protein